jgi:hypothetical protein
MEILQKFAQTLNEEINAGHINLTTIINTLRKTGFVKSEVLQKLDETLLNEAFDEFKTINLNYAKENFLAEKDQINSKSKHIPSREYCKFYSEVLFVIEKDLAAMTEKDERDYDDFGKHLWGPAYQEEIEKIRFKSLVNAYDRYISCWADYYAMAEYIKRDNDFKNNLEKIEEFFFLILTLIEYFE